MKAPLDMSAVITAQLIETSFRIYPKLNVFVCRARETLLSLSRRPER